MLRIHFSSDDIARTRVATRPDVLWEIVLSMHLLQGGADGALAFDDWRREVRSRLREPLTVLRPLNPARGYIPDFLTPAEGVHGLDAGIDALLSTPRKLLRNDLRTFAANHDLPWWAGQLADGAMPVMRRLESEIRFYYGHAIAPFWPDIKAHVDADRAHRACAFLDGGSEGLLESLRPILRWHRPVLEADYPTDREIKLDGRGVLLVPSFFCWRRPVTLADETRTPVLVYPVDRTPQWLGRLTGDYRGSGDQPLSELLGRTRAAVLAALVEPAGNGELASRVRIAPSSASEHVAVLRATGLVASERMGRQVRHRLTPVGLALVTGTPLAQPAAARTSEQTSDLS